MRIRGGVGLGGVSHLVEILVLIQAYYNSIYNFISFEAKGYKKRD